MGQPNEISAQIERPSAAPARSMARDWFSLAGAKVYFICSSYAIHLALPRILESPQQYGLFSSAFALIVLLNGAIGGANMQATSRAISAQPDQYPAILRQTLVLQKIVSLSCAVLLYVGADWIGSLFRDPDLGILLRCGSGGVFAVALYTTFVGVSNGRQRFRDQAIQDVIFSTLRAGGVLLGAWFGGSAMMAAFGFSVTTMLLLIMMLFWFGVGSGAAVLEPRKYLQGFASIAMYLTLFNALQQLDLYVMKRALSFDPDRANHVVGLYRAAQIFAFIPLQAVMATAQVAFPAIARAAAQKDHTRIQTTLRAVLLITLWTVLAIAAPLSATAQGFIALAFPIEYAPSAAALQVLAFAMAALGLFVVSASALNSAGRTRASVSAALIGCIALAIACRVLLAAASTEAEALRLTALGSLLGATASLAALGFTIQREFRGLPAIAPVLRALFATALAYLTALFIPHQTAPTALGAFLIGVVVFALTLYALGDLRPARIREMLNELRQRSL